LQEPRDLDEAINANATSQFRRVKLNRAFARAGLALIYLYREMSIVTLQKSCSAVIITQISMSLLNVPLKRD